MNVIYLCVTEFHATRHKVRNVWAKEIWKKGWGLNVRIRVTLRKQLGREPYHVEFKACQESGGKYQDITSDDIRAAFDCGEEVSRSLTIS